MSRRSFYEVPESAWLFRGAGHQPKEEPVRQWCAHELIRAYGLRVLDLTFEAKVKVGSKTYRIDILVHRDGQPWIVVECKHPGEKDPGKGLEQAVSYADSQTIRAEFAMCTNGSAWWVKQRFPTGWIPVNDLPVNHGSTTERNLAAHLVFIERLKPMLATLDQPIAGTKAWKWFEALQSFFNGGQLWCREMDPALMFAADNVLRLFALPDDHPRYQLGKLAAAYKALDNYAQTLGLAPRTLVMDSAGDIRRRLEGLRQDWVNFIVPAAGIDTRDGPLIILMAALLDYARPLPAKPRQYPAIPAALQTRFREFVDFALRIHFGLTLPQVDDTVLMNRLRTECAPKRRWLQ